MKVQEITNKITITEEFRGIAVCRSGLNWIIADDGAICLGENEEPSLCYDLGEWRNAIETQGPFTKFEGQLVLEND